MRTAQKIVCILATTALPQLKKEYYCVSASPDCASSPSTCELLGACRGLENLCNKFLRIFADLRSSSLWSPPQRVAHSKKAFL
mmetsp:Transcript_22585/g.31581  ORF Transcript_22585/g.31581 Transcript_22585/m.31581 type:complete len:83 (-) Transcript_22585:875-1123(-)